jgi:hypothetical protein
MSADTKKRKFLLECDEYIERLQIETDLADINNKQEVFLNLFYRIEGIKIAKRIFTEIYGEE